MYCIFLRVAHFVHRNFLFCTDLDSLIRKFCLFSFSLLHYLSNKEFCKGVSVKENLYHHCQYWTSFLARLIHKIKWITYQKKENFWETCAKNCLKSVVMRFPSLIWNFQFLPAEMRNLLDKVEDELFRTLISFSHLPKTSRRMLQDGSSGEPRWYCTRLKLWSRSQDVQSRFR